MPAAEQPVDPLFLRVRVKHCAWTEAPPRPGQITKPGPRHVVIDVAKKRDFSQLDVGEPEQRQHERQSERRRRD